MLADDLRRGLDPTVFARDALRFQPDPWQAKVLRWAGNRLLLNCHRQAGKSTTAAVLALHRAIFLPGSLVLLISPSLRQSSELLRRVYEKLSALDERPQLDEESKLSLETRHGSRIVSLPSTEGTVRGYSGASLIIEDEASRVEDQLYYAVRPMLAVSGGGLILMSTPFGKRGHFHKEWTEGEGWERIMVKATECPRIAPQFLKEEREAIGDWWFRQEYLCNPPEAPIWMGDFSFQPLGHVVPGDMVIGWHRSCTSGKRWLTRAKVLAAGRREAEIVEVRMASGNVFYCTADHRWLTMSAGHGRDHFVPASIGKRFVHVVSPTAPLPEQLRWDAAWLGGIYDGEACANQIAQSAAHNPAIRQRIEHVLQSLGFHVANHVAGVYFMSPLGRSGFRQAMVDFLNWTKPTKWNRHMDRLILGAHFRHADAVVDVRPAGRSEVVSLQTTTGNYVVWGYASKNCEFVDTEGQVFSSEEIRAALSSEVKPLFGGDVRG